MTVPHQSSGAINTASAAATAAGAATADATQTAAGGADARGRRWLIAVILLTAGAALCAAAATPASWSRPTSSTLPLPVDPDAARPVVLSATSQAGPDMPANTGSGVATAAAPPSESSVEAIPNTMPPTTLSAIDGGEDPRASAERRDVAEAAAVGPQDPDQSEFSMANMTKHRRLPTDVQVRAFFKDVMLIVMMGPGRYDLVDLVRAHYAPFFRHMFFTGPRNATSAGGVVVHGYDTLYGNEQYRAVSRIVRRLEADEESKEAMASVVGYLYVCDDMMVQPWALLHHNRSRIWAPQMGVANLLSSRRRINAVPGMSVEQRFRGAWPHWNRNRPKLMRALGEAGPLLTNGLAESARHVHPKLREWSRYDGRYLNNESLPSTVFYTVADTYYLPRRFGLPYAALCDIMEKHLVHGECAIATMLRALDWNIEEMHLQYYWSTLNASDCPRRRWSLAIAGFHRCRHDHPFAEAIFNEAARRRILADNAYRSRLMRIEFGEPMPQP